MTKICSKCGSEKDLDCFHKRKDNKYYSYCIDCHKEYVKGHYQKNLQYYSDKAKRNRINAKEKYFDYKRTLSCTDCGISFKDKPYLCDFHHLDGEDKEFSPSLFRESWKRLLKEIEKCVPLCANCHRIRHYGDVA